MADYERTIELIKGEAKTLSYTWTENGSPKNLTGATFRARGKAQLSDPSYLIEVDDADFDKAEVAQGKVSFELTKTMTLIAPYHEELECYIQVEVTLSGNGGVDKSFIDVLKLAGTVFHD